MVTSCSRAPVTIVTFRLNAGPSRAESDCARLACCVGERSSGTHNSVNREGKRTCGDIHAELNSRTSLTRRPAKFVYRRLDCAAPKCLCQSSSLRIANSIASRFLLHLHGRWRPSCGRSTKDIGKKLGRRRVASGDAFRSNAFPCKLEPAF